eukprot:TRINITY_DN976_c0_g1_i1.p1 TRINITY_DN976_c0_g1~~TRINITY_DN976_c0_g1_i1.p1  ORF type:complete len:1666 (+),score=653.65 TRINITY_DN976_c0_g1_i1:360-5000(+)
MFGDTTEEAQIGLIPRLTHKIFKEIESRQSSLVRFKVYASYMEIYNEKVKCLLNPSLEGTHLKVREHPVTGPYVENLTQMEVKSHQEVFRVMHEGNKLRTTASTCMNAHSSRSHAVFQLTMMQEILMENCDEILSSKTARLNLVDLAGSERVAKTQATGTRLLEGANINKSLATLGQVISALADEACGKKKHIPYRDSVLTWILKDNLGGNSKTMMIATVSPSFDNYEETMSTLRYAERAKKIVNKAVVNEDANSALVQALKEEIQKLQSQLQGKSDSSAELDRSRAMMHQLEMTWEEKLKQAQEQAAKHGELVHREKEALEAEIEGLMLERNKQTQELATMQKKLEQKETQMEDVIKEMKRQEAEYEKRLRSLPSKDEDSKHELMQLRQQIAVMTAQAEARKRDEERKQALQAGLPHKVVALLHTLQVSDVTPEEKHLLSKLSVKEMAMVYDSLGEGQDAAEVWDNLRLRLEAKEALGAAGAEYDSTLDSLLNEEAKTDFLLDGDDLVSSPRGGDVKNSITFFSHAEQPVSPPTMKTTKKQKREEPRDEEEDLLDQLLDDDDEEPKEEVPAETEKLLDEILGDDDDKKDKEEVDQLLDDLLSDDEDNLDKLLDGSSEEEQDLLDELLDDEPEEADKPRESTMAQSAGNVVSMDDEKDEDDTALTEDQMLEELLGDNIDNTVLTPKMSLAPSKELSKVKICFQGDDLDKLRTDIWNIALFNCSKEVSVHGDAFVAQLLDIVQNAKPRTTAEELAKSLGGVVPQPPFGEKDYSTRLKNFYCFYNKSRLEHIDHILSVVAKTGKSDKLMDTACKKYMGCEPVLLTKPPVKGVTELKNSHWFWGPILSGRGPPDYIPDSDDEEVSEHPLMASPKFARKEGQVDESAYWKARLTRYFNYYQQSRSEENINQLIKNFKGMENQMMQALVAKYGPEPVGRHGAAPVQVRAQASKADNYGSTNNPIRIDMNSVDGHGALLSGFKVLKINPRLGNRKLKAAKDRIWVIDFFAREFRNIAKGTVSGTFDANHLFRIEKLFTSTKQLRLSFYKAPHPYILEFMSTESRQRFYELAWATRRHICWLPDLVPRTHTAVSVNIMGRSKKHKEINGICNLHVTREPCEMLTIWSGCLSLSHKTLPAGGPSIMHGFLPRPTKYDLHFICFTDLPESYSKNPAELVDYFRPYCSETDLHPFLSTNLGDSPAVVLALAKRRHISKVGNMEAIELRDQNTMVVGLSMRYGESSIALLLTQMSNTMPIPKKNHKVATIMRKLDIGDCRLEFSCRFDFVIWMGCFGYGGTPHEADDELAEEISNGNLMHGYSEPSVSRQECFRSNSFRTFVKASRPSSFHPITYTTVPVTSAGACATVFASAFSMQRPYLASLVTNKPKPAKYFFLHLEISIPRKEIVNHLGITFNLAIMSPYMEGASVMVKMVYNDLKKAYVAQNQDEVPPIHMVTNTDVFLSRQVMTFSIVSSSAAPPEFPYASWATGALYLKHYTETSRLSHFQIALWRTALRVGTISGECIRVPWGLALASAIRKSREHHVDPGYAPPAIAN